MEPLVFARRDDHALRTAAQSCHDRLRSRRTVRDFAPDPVPRDVIATCIQTAGTAPNGANLQPWHFVAVSDAVMKRRIREAAEAEEREFYAHRANDVWKEALAPLRTNAEKPYLETAPWLIAIFAVNAFNDPATGERRQTYYAKESVGIATGFLIAALHEAGLATLTHTPSPMGFLNELLGRPSTEKPFLLLIVGHPAPGAMVPVITKKPLREIATFV